MVNDEFFDAEENFLKIIHNDLKNSQQDFVIEILREEIESGLYGEKVQNVFLKLPDQEKDLILRALKLQEIAEGRKLMFRLAAQSIFPRARMYFNDGKFLLYLPEDESEIALQKIELIKLLFMDVSNTELDVYFRRSFGVFGTPDTMLLEKIVLY